VDLEQCRRSHKRKGDQNVSNKRHGMLVVAIEAVYRRSEGQEQGAGTRRRTDISLFFVPRGFTEQRVARDLQGKRRMHDRFYSATGSIVAETVMHAQKRCRSFSDLSGGHPRCPPGRARVAGVDGDVGSALSLSRLARALAQRGDTIKSG
jgi:hypothetical protein